MLGRNLEAVEAVLQNAFRPELKTPEHAKKLANFIDIASRIPIFKGVVVMEWVHEPRLSVEYMAEPWEQGIYGKVPEDQKRLSALNKILGGNVFCDPIRFNALPGLPDINKAPERYVDCLNRRYLSLLEQQRFLGLIPVNGS